MRPFVAVLPFLAAAASLVSAGNYDYGEVIHKSLLFYEAERSGDLPDNNRVDWRGDSGMGDAVVGGYHDAGDHVKFGLPMASMTTQMAWGAITFKNGYSKAGELENVKKAIQWSTDYFVGCHTSKNEFIAQIGDGNADHSYWGRPEEMTMARPAFKIDANNPGTEVACETAAALAAASIFYKANGENNLANEALDHAKELFDLGEQHQGVYTSSIPAGGFYDSYSGFNDEIVWSAAWLYKATNDNKYLSKAEQYWNQFGFADQEIHNFDWDNKVNGANVLLYDLTKDNKYKTEIDQFVSYTMNQAQYTPKGLIYIDAWGTLRHAGNLAHLCLQIAELGLHQNECRDFAKKQIDYALGDGGHSYVVGFGNNPPKRPHHRAASCPDMPQTCDWDAYNNPGDNYQVINGALVGGPDGNDNWNDDRSNFQTNEVATDYNAGFQSALAGLNM